ncbi:MAG: hypothetical protein R2697_02145 [Ilumatobacteraceae bacterium]
MSVIDGAPAVFLAGDSAIHLRSAIKNTPVYAALERLIDCGGTLIATGPSASALCDPMTDRRGGVFTIGLGLVNRCGGDDRDRRLVAGSADSCP